MAQALEFPEAPKNVKCPKYLRQHEVYARFSAKMLQNIQHLPPNQQKQLSTFIQSELYPGVPEKNVQPISSSPNKLMKHIEQYCNPFNMELLKRVAKHLKDDELTIQLEQCELTLSAQLQDAVWDTEVKVAPPAGYKILLVKMGQRGNTTVGEAVKMRAFLAEHLMFKGQQGILYLAGLANDSLVFYLSEGNVGPMLQRMKHEKDKMLADAVEEVIFDQLARLDVKSGAITPHPDVRKLDPAAECPHFGVLLIGDTGVGKSTLINNLLGRVVAPEGDTSHPETDKIREYRGTVAGVPVILYDTPGTDSSGASDKELCREIKKLFTSKKICLTIFCFSMNEQRLKRSHIATMRTYNEAAVNWDSTIVALTFADKIKAPRAERKSEGFREAEYFQRRIKEWEVHLRDTLVKDVGVSPSVARSLNMRPTTDEWESQLPDNEEWFVPLWLDILDSLEPAAYFRFLEINRDNVTFATEPNDSSGKIHLTGKYLARFRTIAENKVKVAYTGSALASTTGAVVIAAGVGVAVATASTAIGLATCGAGAVIIVGGLAAIGVVAFIALVHQHRKSAKENKE